MVDLHAHKVVELTEQSLEEQQKSSLTFLGDKEREFLRYLRKHRVSQFTPIEMASKLGVTNRTIINWSTTLVQNGFLTPVIARQRIRSYIVN